MSEKNSLDAALPQSKKIRNYEIKRLPLGAYFSLIRKLESLPSNFIATVAGVFSDMKAAENEEEREENNAKIIEVVAKLIAQLPDEILSIIAHACDVKKEVLENDRDLGIDGFTELAIGVWEVNDLGNVFCNIKKKLPESLRKYVDNLIKIGTTGSTK